MKVTRLRAVVAAASAVALVAAGCGDDSDDSDDAAVEAADDGETIVVRAIDFEFEDLPDTVSVGTELTLVNDSEDEVHELVAFRLPDDEDMSVEELLEQAPDEDEADEEEGPPAMVLVAMPGEEGEAVVGDGTLTEPGRYAIICAIPSGADPEEFMAAVEEFDEAEDEPPDVAGGPPHFVHGMFAELIVE